MTTTRETRSSSHRGVVNLTSVASAAPQPVISQEYKLPKTDAVDEEKLDPLSTEEIARIVPRRTSARHPQPSAATLRAAVEFLWWTILEVVRAGGALTQHEVCRRVEARCDRLGLPRDPNGTDAQVAEGRLGWRADAATLVALMAKHGVLVVRPVDVKKAGAHAHRAAEGVSLETAEGASSPPAKGEQGPPEQPPPQSEQQQQPTEPQQPAAAAAKEPVEEEEEKKELPQAVTTTNKETKPETDALSEEEEKKKKTDETQEPETTTTTKKDAEDVNTAPKHTDETRKLMALSGSVSAEAKALAEAGDFDAIGAADGETAKRAAMTWAWNVSQTLPFSEKLFNLAREGRFEEIDDCAGEAAAQTLSSWCFFKFDDWASRRAARVKSLDDRQTRTLAHALEQLHPDRARRVFFGGSSSVTNVGGSSGSTAPRGTAIHNKPYRRTAFSRDAWARLALLREPLVGEGTAKHDKHKPTSTTRALDRWLLEIRRREEEILAPSDDDPLEDSLRLSVDESRATAALADAGVGGFEGLVRAIGHPRTRRRLDARLDDDGVLVFLGRENDDDDDPDKQPSSASSKSSPRNHQGGGPNKGSLSKSSHAGGTSGAARFSSAAAAKKRKRASSYAAEDATSDFLDDLEDELDDDEDDDDDDDDDDDEDSSSDLEEDDVGWGETTSGSAAHEDDTAASRKFAAECAAKLNSTLDAIFSVKPGDFIPESVAPTVDDLIRRARRREALFLRRRKKKRRSSRPAAVARRARFVVNDSLLSPLATDPTLTLARTSKPVDWRDVVRHIERTPLLTPELMAAAKSPSGRRASGNLHDAMPPPPPRLLPVPLHTSSGGLQQQQHKPSSSNPDTKTNNDKKVPSFRKLEHPFGEDDDEDSSDNDSDDDLDPDAMLRRHARVLEAMKARIDALVRDAKKAGSTPTPPPS